MQLPTSAISHPKTMAKNERASGDGDVLGTGRAEGDFDALQLQGFRHKRPIFHGVQNCRPYVGGRDGQHSLAS